MIKRTKRSLNGFKGRNGNDEDDAPESEYKLSALNGGMFDPHISLGGFTRGDNSFQMTSFKYGFQGAMMMTMGEMPSMGMGGSKGPGAFCYRR